MKVVFTDDALADLDSIADWLTVNYPAIAPLVGRRIQGVIAHIARWPESQRSARRIPKNPRRTSSRR